MKENEINKIVDEQSFLEINLKKIYSFLEEKDQSILSNFVKDLHNADIAEIIQTLDNETRLTFILILKY